MKAIKTLFFLAVVLLTTQSQQAQDATFLPQPPANVEIITPDNAHRLAPLATLGRGEIQDMAWSPDEALFAIKTSIGIWIYEDLQEEPFLIEGQSDSAAFDAEWNTLAIHNKGRIDIWHLRNLERQQATVEAGNRIMSDQPLFISPDGSRLYFLVAKAETHNKEIWRWDVPENQLQDSLAVGNHYISGMVMSPRSDALLITRSVSELLVLLGDTLETISLHRPKGPQPTDFVFHPVEPVIAYSIHSSEEARIYLFNYKTQQENAAFSLPHASVWLFFSPQGGQLLARLLYPNNDLYVWDVDTDTIKTAVGEVTMEEEFRAPNIRFSPDGRFLVIESGYRGEVWDLEALQPLEATWKPDMSMYTRFNPSGDQVMVGDFTYTLFSLEDEVPIREMVGEGSPIFSPSGEQIALIERSSRSVLIYSAVKEGDAVRLSGYGSFSTLGFSPQGRYLVTQSGRKFGLWEAPFTDFSTIEIPGWWPVMLAGTDESMRFSIFNFDEGSLTQGEIEQIGDTFEVNEYQILDLSQELPDDPDDFNARLRTYALDHENNIFIAAGGEDTDYYNGTPYLFLRDLISGRYQYIYGHTG